jgi:glycosyltransferase involved in cell wall biosynthesis
MTNRQSTGRAAPQATDPPPAPFTLVVLAHLHWDWVWQRPQHLLTRMAQAGHPVIYVMEPWWNDEATTPRLHLEERQENLTLATPVISPAHGDDNWGHYRIIGRLVDDLLAERGDREVVYWLYTPLALPAVEGKDDALVVFDVMDELSSFKYAPADMVERDRRALTRADLVFTGGPSLYNARKDRHPRVHLFPSGVDADHFARALHPATPIPPVLDALPRPRIGFFGVIDERTDLELLGAVAALRPAYQWVMVGPHIKIDPADLPQAANIHYLGQQPYSELPGFCKGFDLCMMPFARNEATRFISPTKTLEYMAAHKPIVSTRITDVAEPYAHIVYLADTPAEFVAAVDAALHEPPARQAARRAAEREVLARQAWDEIAANMRALIAERQAARAAPPDPAVPPPSAVQPSLSLLSVGD